jgi:hypothetical protein
MRLLTCGLLLVGFSVLTGLDRLAAADDFQPEPGFTLLFNGKDLTGWKSSKGDDLNGRTEAGGNRFKVSDGTLIIDPAIKGNLVINSVKEFAGDVHIKFDFLPGPGCNNDLYLRGTKFDLKKGGKASLKSFKEGEWNQFEIIVKGDQVEFKNNGETQDTLKATSPKSPLGIRAEFGPIQIRRLRVKEGS